MTDKITLATVSNPQNLTSLATTLNANFSTIQTAFDNNLSRDGTSPNQMESTLDMNSNQIINLPAPSTVNSPARLIDVTTNPTIVIPGTGTSGHVVPFLDGNNTFSGTDTFNGNNTYAGTNTYHGNNAYTGNDSYAGTETFNGPVVFNSTVTGLPATVFPGWTNNTYSNITSTYSVQTTDNGKTIALGGGTFFTVTFGTASSYPSNFVCMLCNIDTYPGGRGKTVAYPGGSFILYPGQNALVFMRNAGTPIWDYHPKNQRWVSNSVTFFVDNNGSDSNDGLVTGTGAFATFQAAATAGYYNVDSRGGSVTISATAGQTFTQQVNLGGSPLGTNLLTIGSTTSSPFIWQTKTGGGSMLVVGDHSQVALSNCSFISSNNTFGQAACYLHNDGLIDFGPGISFQGGGTNDSAIFLDNNSCIMTVANGFTCSNTFGDLIHFDGGGAATISGTISPSGTTVVGQFIHLKAKARAIMGTQPTTTGYTSIGTSVVEQTSILITNGVTIPGGTSTATGGVVD